MAIGVLVEVLLPDGTADTAGKPPHKDEKSANRNKIESLGDASGEIRHESCWSIAQHHWYDYQLDLQ